MRHYPHSGTRVFLRPLKADATLGTRVQHLAVSEAMEAVGTDAGAISDWVAEHYNEYWPDHEIPNYRLPIRQLVRKGYLVPFWKNTEIRWNTD